MMFHNDAPVWSNAFLLWTLHITGQIVWAGKNAHETSCSMYSVCCVCVSFVVFIDVQLNSLLHFMLAGLQSIKLKSAAG